MISLDDFSYLSKRLKRDPDSSTGQALHAVFVGGKTPIEAIRPTGVPMVRFSPVYEEALKIVGAMTLTEADGFTAEELPIANRALRVSRLKESAYVPSIADYTALERLHNKGGTALKDLTGSTDELPGVAASTLWVLEANGLVTATSLGGPRFSWSLTAAGAKARLERFK